MDGLLIAITMGLGIILPSVMIYLLYKVINENKKLAPIPVRVDEEYPPYRY